jgi:G:T-mismatch repair DNA endonuclease (very short patch repair protein)
VLRKNILKPHTIGLIPAGGYSCNQNYSKKALMWLLHMEQADGCRILHARNGREYRLPKLPFYSVDGCVETRTVFEFFGCFYHRCQCRSFRDLPTLAGDILSERYERTMARIERIARAGYNVTIQWESKFDEAKIVNDKPELLTHPIVRHNPLKTRDSLYGGRNESMRLHYKIGANEKIEYCDVISLYPYICKYFKFSTGHPVIHVGEMCKYVEACLQINGLIKCRSCRLKACIIRSSHTDLIRSFHSVCVVHVFLTRTLGTLLLHRFCRV